MTIVQRTYVLNSALEPSEVLRRAGALLASEGVNYTSGQLSIASTNTPLAILGTDRMLYTRKNWIGINPFTHVSAVSLTCERAGNRTNVIVRVDRTRAFLFALYWVACAGLSALCLPAVGVLFLSLAVACIAWFQIAIVGGRLVATELEVGLASSTSAA